MNALTTTFYQLLADNLPLRSEKIAIIDGEETITYGELFALSDRLASYLESRDIVAGDRVIVHLRKSIAEVAAMFAVAKIGGVIVNVSTQWTLNQLEYVAADCGARMLIVEARTAAQLSLRSLPAKVENVLVKAAFVNDDRFDAFDDFKDQQHGQEVSRLETELSTILYTSGSTGQPKGVMLSHRNIVAGARSVARYLSLQENDRLLSVLPYSFDYGLNQLTTMMLMGGTVVHQAVAMPAEIVATVRRHQATGLAAVPPLWHQIVRMLIEAPVELPSLKRVTNSGGKIPLNILQAMPKVLPNVAIYLMYGLTEAFRSTYLDPKKFGRKMGAIGQAIPGAEVYVIKQGRGVAGPGEQGELVHRGCLVSLGYWGKPEETESKIRPCSELRSLIGDEPVVYSGDTVRVDEEGDLWFVGRNDAMIKTRGFRVSPDEVEDLLYRSGVIAEAVAFAVDHDEFGQAIHVAVTSIGHFDEEAVMRHCRSVMPSYMVPSRFHPWPEGMPRTASGKLARPEVVKASLLEQAVNLAPVRANVMQTASNQETVK